MSVIVCPRCGAALTLVDRPLLPYVACERGHQWVVDVLEARIEHMERYGEGSAQ